MSYTRRVLRGISLVFVFSIFTNVFGYLLRIYLGRTLPQDEFGMVYAVFALFGLIMFFVYMGFTESTVKFIADFRAKKQTKNILKTITSVLSLEMLLSLIVTIVLVSIAPWVAAIYFHSAAATPLIMVYAISMLFSPLEILMLKLFQSFQKLAYYSVMQFSRAVVVFLLTVLFLTQFPEWGVLGAVLPYPIVSLLSFFVFYPIFRHRVFQDLTLKTKNIDWKLLKKIAIYGIPIALTTLSGTILVHTDTIMITAFRTLEEVGLYNAALPTANMLLFLGSSVFTVFFPIVAELWAKKKRKLLAQILGESYVLLAAAVLPAAVLFFVFPDIVLNLLFGAEYIPAYTALKVLAISSIFATLSMFAGSFLSGIGKPQLTTKSVVVGAVFNVVANLILIPTVGFVGAAYATLVAQVFMFGAKTYYVWKNVHFSFPMHKLLLILFSGALLVPGMNFLREAITLPVIPKLAIVCGALAVAYAALILVFRVVTIGRLKELATEFLGSRT